MPKENKHARGRRGGKKREREEPTIEDDVNKRPKPNADGDYVFHAEDLAAAFDGRNPFDNDDAARAPPAVPEEDAGEDDRPFYGMLADEEQEYFRHADELLELNDFPSEEDRDLFLANVYREAEGKELKIANSQSCSRLMERLILLSNVAQKKKLFAAFSGNFLHLIQHRFASHCCEKLFIHSAPIVTKEVLGTDDKPEEKKQEKKDEEKEADPETLPDAPAEDNVPNESMENLFLYTLNELEGQMSYLLTDRFASHTMRVLLIVLSGRPLESSSVKSLLKSKKKEDVAITGFDSRSEELILKERVVPDSFTFAIEKILDDITTELDTTSIRVLATHQTGNPSLQLLLELDLARKVKKEEKNEKKETLITRLLPDDLNDPESESIKFISSLMYDPIGSRLVETIVRCAQGKLFKQLYKTIFQERIGSLARNEIASYVVIRVLERMSKQDLEAAVALIKPEIPNLVSRSRTAVLKSLLERCQVRGASNAVMELVNSIESAYDTDAANLLLKMVQIEPEEVSKAVQSQTTNKPTANQLHGSLLAQAMLSIPGRATSLIRSSLLAVSPEVMLYLGNNTVTSHIIQAAFTTLPSPPSPSDATFCRKLINSIIPHIKELALSSSGSHVLDVILNTTVSSPVLFFVTERITKALVEHEEVLRDSRPGRLVWRNWRCELYSRDREAWVRKIKSHSVHQKRESAKATHQPGPTSQENGSAGKPAQQRSKQQGRANGAKGGQGQGKTAIQLARERFAAQKNGQLTGANASGPVRGGKQAFKSRA